MAETDEFMLRDGDEVDRVGKLIEVECSNGNDDELDNISLTKYVENNDNWRTPIQTSSPIQSLEIVETNVSTTKVSVMTSVDPPKVGMMFNGWEEIVVYYKSYAERCGFGISRVQTAYTLNKKEIRGMTWKCECWGPPNLRAQREARKRARLMEVGGSVGNRNGDIVEDELARCKRKSKKCECQARIYGSVNREGLWVLVTVELEHTHKLDPAMAKLVKEYRMKKMTSTVRKRLNNYFEVGLPVTKIRGCLGTENENLPNVKDMQHEVYKKRRSKMAGGDANAMMEYFDYMQADNHNFFHVHRLDEEGRLKDVLWVDARSIAAYEDFGDVVCFDATYLTNEYELPFCNFVGVNHHGQSLLLGCALISREDSDTFRWIFRQWLSCMGNKAPEAILTDQAPAMRKPLAEVMPNTRHRWCIWHILKKFPEKLGKCELYNDFKNPLKNVIYDSLTIDEFQTRWCEAMKLYKLEDNEWLQELFVERHMWVPAFMKEYFWAGMKTTQRVESINSFFDGFVDKHTKLCEFPEKYSQAMKKRVSDETDADDRDSKYIRRLVSGFKVEKFFQKIYTDVKFQEVQKECGRMLYVIPKVQDVISSEAIKYVIEDRVWIKKSGTTEEKLTDFKRLYSVTFNLVTKDSICDCRKFEKDGILCRHIIRVWDDRKVKDIPPKFVLVRWRKDVVRRHTRVKVAYHDPSHTTECKRYNSLIPDLEALCDDASVVDDETVEAVRKEISKLHAVVKEKRAKLLEKLAVPNPEINSKTSPPVPTPMSSPLQQATPSATTSPAPTTPLSASTELAALSPQISGGGQFTPISNYNHPPKSPCNIRDPIIKKKPRGRPKGSRNKSFAELG
ncbi:protein FAR1-RELATED SEQUENCE 8-like [Chenopodium quinoa]|uniref:protein FAR1-RELATED SEQUENCE 8-like n=1 Tax=Chenopodium quinoa TaxID=63459 RepID=UPI000B7997CD|nr:protein FAR1-RELATED SEQUENCE 8-like [Chenopodium quinoa]